MIRRRGVVLLITIGFMITLMALIGYQLTLVDKGLKQSSREGFYYQSSLVLSDIRSKLVPQMLQELSGMDLNDTDSQEVVGEILSAWYDIPFPLINDEKFGSVTVTIQPAAKRFNINQMASLPIYNRIFFEHFTNTLVDNMLLMDMIDLALQTDANITNRWQYLAQDNDLVLNSPFFRKGSITSKEQFDIILKAYADQMKDPKVYELPWDDFVTFHDTKKLSFAQLSDTFCQYLFYERGPSWWQSHCKNPEMIPYTEEDIHPSEDENLTLHYLKIDFNAYDPQMLIDVFIEQNGLEARYEMFYDISAKKTLWTRAKL